MKKSMTALAGVIVACAATTGFSGPQCCPASKKVSVEEKSDKIASAKATCSMDCLVSADLSEEQWEQIKTFKAECDANGGCSVESANKMKEKLASVLSSDQMQKMMASCSEKGCVMPQAKAEETSNNMDDVDVGPAG